jgi:hypothetical protein
MPVRKFAALTAALTLPTAVAFAQTKPPIAQFWMDVATINMSIPGMGEMEGGGVMGMLGGSIFGTTKMGVGEPGKWLDTALYTRNKPAGTEATHAIPPTLNMGTSLPLLPVQHKTGSTEQGLSEEPEPEKPKGKLLFYWGCSEKVRPGQPRVIDFSKANPGEWGRFMVGRFAPDRGAKAVPGRSIWPNERNRQRVPKDASLSGEHNVSGEGVPPGLRFAVNEFNDFMPRVQMSAAGDPKSSVAVSWQGIPASTGYFLNAMGARGENEMIVWSSSDQPDPGWGLLDYLTPTKVKQLVGEKVVLPPGTEKCAIPEGIFGGTEGAMVRMIAYGPELNLAHPPRPADPKVRWEPDWAVRVRIKSTGMTMLGMDEQGGGKRGAANEEQPAQQGGVPGIGDINPLNAIKGIFGR